MNIFSFYIGYFITKLKYKIKHKYISKSTYEFLINGGILGEDFEIQKDVVFGSEPYLIKIGNHCRIVNGVKFITHDGGLWVLRKLYPEMINADRFGRIIIGDNVHIGSNSIIMPGVKIGNNCIIGCGAIVTKDIPDNSIAVGVPARVIESIDDYYNKNKNRIVETKRLSSKQKKDFLLKF